MLNPSRMSAGKDLGMYFSVSGVQTRKHSLFCFCGCYVSAGHTSPCSGLPPHSIPGQQCDQREAREEGQVEPYQEIRLSGAEPKSLR